MNLLKELAHLGSDSKGSSSTTQNWYITAERAEGVKDVDIFSKSDPYLKIEFGGKHFKTKTIKNNLSPYWNETFHFAVSPQHAGDIHLTLMDAEMLLDDHIGKAVVSRADLPAYPGEEKKNSSLHVPKATGYWCSSFTCYIVS